MSPSLPPEILDHIVDHLHNEPITLKTCCVVSKSWIQRTRIHLFASLEFYALKSHIELWKKTFPDPSSSPAHHTRSLSIRGIPPITAADGDVGGWIRTFQNLAHFHLESLNPDDRQTPLVAFYGLSPTLKSLRLTCISSEVLDLICSFPLLEDLALISLGPGSDAWNTPSTSPKLTGSLELKAFGEFRTVARRLLDLPDGLHFTKITAESLDEDVKSIMDLVSRCSNTLGSLEVSFFVPAMSGAPPLDLSKATKLKDLSLRCAGANIRRFTITLQTIRSKNLQQITIHTRATIADLQLISASIRRYSASANPVEEKVRQEWQDLDRLLVQFWISHSIRPKITYETWKIGDDSRGLVQSLLPELTRRGLVDLIEHQMVSQPVEE